MQIVKNTTILFDPILYILIIWHYNKINVVKLCQYQKYVVFLHNQSQLCCNVLI